MPTKDDGVGYGGPNGQYQPGAGQNQVRWNQQLTADGLNTYARPDYLLDRLNLLLTTVNSLIDEFESELQRFALPITDSPDDALLKEAHANEWPSTLGPNKEYITYRYYKALGLRDSSAATFIRRRYEEAARDVNGTASIDLLPLAITIRDETLLAQEFAQKYVTFLDDSATRRTVELLQDWVEAALNHAGNLGDIFQKGESSITLPDSEVEQITPEEARNSQAVFKVNLAQANKNLEQTLAFINKNYSSHADVFYKSFLDPAMRFRQKVTKKIYPILPGRLGEEVNIATNALDNKLDTILGDQLRRNLIFDQKMKEVEAAIQVRDKYRSYIRQLGVKGTPVPTNVSGTLITETDASEEAAFFDLVVEANEQATPSGKYDAPHQYLSGTDNPEAHPQYLLKDGGTITGDIAASEDVRIDGVDLDKHEHSGIDGSTRIHGSSLIGGTLSSDSVDTSEVPNVPTNLRLVNQKTRVIPPGVSVVDATIAWDSNGNTYEVQITPLG